MLMELAYRLVTEDSPLADSIRSNVIVAIMPVADPDGRDRSIDWYFAHNIDVTDYEKMSGVPYWGSTPSTMTIATLIMPAWPIRTSCAGISTGIRHHARSA